MTALFGQWFSVNRKRPLLTGRWSCSSMYWPSWGTEAINPIQTSKAARRLAYLNTFSSPSIKEVRSMLMELYLPIPPSWSSLWTDSTAALMIGLQRVLIGSSLKAAWPGNVDIMKANSSGSVVLSNDVGWLSCFSAHGWVCRRLEKSSNMQ